MTIQDLVVQAGGGGGPTDVVVDATLAVQIPVTTYMHIGNGASTMTLTLPTAASVPEGHTLKIKRINLNNVIVVPDAGDFLETGVLPFDYDLNGLFINSSVDYISDGVLDWYIG